MSRFSNQLMQLDTFFFRFPPADVALWKKGTNLPMRIMSFLSAYPSSVVNAWRTGDLPTATDTPLSQRYQALTDEAKQFLSEEAKLLTTVMPCPLCSKPLHLAGVCPGCQKGREGMKSKLYCKTPACTYEDYFQSTVKEFLEAI